MTANKKISGWLFFCAFTIVIMILIGGITRLTESGLSIVEWKPVTGAMFPMDAAAWASEFALYQQSPQYEKVNAGMSLSDFKKIYFWEWVHRLWGRLIGLFFALPLIFFWRRIPQEKKKYFIGILGLGFAQGAMGWYMVKSGLVDMPAVSHYRLAMHFMLAVIIYACLFRLGLAFLKPPVLKFSLDHDKIAHLRSWIKKCILAVGFTMTWGAFVAGLDAGFIYNTFPKMDTHWLPPEMFFAQPMILNFFNEPAIVQFTHRVLAILTALLVIGVAIWGIGVKTMPSRLKALFLGAVAAVTLQVMLGVTTLLTHMNLHVAVTHQLGAIVVLTMLLWILHDLPITEKRSS